MLTVLLLDDDPISATHTADDLAVSYTHLTLPTIELV